MSHQWRSATVGIVALLLLATAVPATAWSGEDTRRPQNTVDSMAKEGPSMVQNDPPRALKLRAIERLETMNVDSWFERRYRDRAVRLLNGTVAAYRDGGRISAASVLSNDRYALGRVAPLAWTNRTVAEDVARLVVRADLTTVNISISDANRARKLVQDRLKDRDTRQRADRAIEHAVEARNRAITTLDKDAGPWRNVNRRRALLHLRLAWSHADRALDILGRATSPTIRIESRSDPPGGEVLGNRTIGGVVSHVRAYELGNVSVTVNGSRVGSVPLEASTDPVEDATFEVNLTLDRATAVVAVSVTRDGSKTGPNTERRGWWGWFGGFNTRDDWRWYRDSLPRSARDKSEVGTASVRFDGDGLPDEFETGWSNTDPLDPDSDAQGTARDEGDNARPDGAEDFDGDGLLAYVEYDLGTDPTTADSDSDGLPDPFEARLQVLFDGTDPDIDGDGRVDGKEDFDGDGLPAWAEHANGTSIASADTDGDGLRDGPEVRRHETNPLDPDSDDDGLEDGEELRLGSDPLLMDTDGDGLIDSEEVHKTHVTDQETGVDIALYGSGDVASEIDIEPVAQPANSSFLAGPVVRIRNRSGVDAATVTLPIRNSSRSELGNLSVYTWHPGRDRHWRPLQSRIDRSNGTVSANVSSFSYFTAMDQGEWQSAISDSIAVGWPRHESFDDLDGWTTMGGVAAEGGRLVVSGRPGSDGTPDIVVAADGSGDFEQVQDGVNAAEPGDTLLVKEGVYPETVIVDRSIDLVGDGAVLNGDSLGEHAFYGIKVETHRVSIRGFTIRNYHYNIDARDTTADVTISETVFRRGGWGINARGSVGDWTLTDVEMIETFIEGIDADGSSGDWTLREVNASDSMESGISAQASVGDWSLQDVEFSGHQDFGLRLNGTAGTWRIDDAVITSNGRHGIAATGNDGAISVSHSRIVGNGAAGIGATKGANLVDATNNWWGQAGGPRATQVLGAVDASSACSTPSCGTTAREFRLMSESTEETDQGEERQRQFQSETLSMSQRELALPEDVSAVSISARWRGVAGGVEPSMLRVVSGQEEEIVASATSTSNAFTTATTDVSRFAGSTVTLEATASGGGQIEIDWIDVAIDTDGDGLRDAIERADLGMPTGPRPGASLSALDPTNPDTDGDGLKDGEELTDVIIRVDAADNPGGVSFQASEATSDPTEENSDGGGLNDAEEVEAGSDPFVLETLVAGFTLPTMTHGPEDTIKQSEPMTMAFVDGIQVGQSSESDLVVWPSSQYFDPIFCIKEFTAGPGCAPAWMRGIELQENKHYLYVPFVVYLQTNVHVDDIPYEMVTTPSVSANPVKKVNSSGVLRRGTSRSGYIVYEVRDEQAGVEGYAAAFRSIGDISLEVDLSNSLFYRQTPTRVTRGYSVSTDTLLPHMDKILQKTKIILSQGITIAFAAEDGYEIAVKTGSKTIGALVFLFELAKGQIETPPRSPSDFNQGVAERGITSFREMIQVVSSQIDKEIFGEGAVRPAGPTIIHRN